MTKRPIVAFLYDFDKTLCTTDMEDYAFIPSLGYTPSEFWAKANGFGYENKMDGLLAYMYTMIRECAAQGIRLDRDYLVRSGEAIELFPGVREWFARITAYGADLGVDVEHYEKLAKQSKREYEYCVREYSAYCDANQDVMLQSFISKRDELENEMQLKFNAYSAMRTQLEAMRAKLQEKTPAFTTIESATVPVKPAGPKRIIFIFGMCFLATFVTALWLARKQLFTKA